METREKAALKACTNLLMDDLDPTKSFLAKLHRSNILTEDQRDRVEKQTTRQDKVVTLMEILPRRGPYAFTEFVDVLKTEYPWISEKLESECRRKSQDSTYPISLDKNKNNKLNKIESQTKNNNENFNVNVKPPTNTNYNCLGQQSNIPPTFKPLHDMDFSRSSGPLPPVTHIKTDKPRRPCLEINPFPKRFSKP